MVYILEVITQMITTYQLSKHCKSHLVVYGIGLKNECNFGQQLTLLVAPQYLGLTYQYFLRHSRSLVMTQAVRIMTIKSRTTSRLKKILARVMDGIGK